MSRHHEHALFTRYRQDGDPAARDALVARFLPLARHLARRYAARADIDDLNQVASIGLLKAIERFDPARETAFSSFAVPTILGELRRYFRDYGWTIRVPRALQELSLRLERATEQLTGELGRAPTAAELAEQAGTTTEEVLEALATRTAHRPESLDRPFSDDESDGAMIDRAGGQLDRGFSAVEDAATVDVLLSGLPDRERSILELRFQQELTQAEIGLRFGLSQMHVSRLIRSSIASLQDTAA